MAAGSIVVDAKSVLVVSEVWNELIRQLCISLRLRGCRVLLTGVPIAQMACEVETEFVPSDLATGPGREAMAKQHFDTSQVVILVGDEVTGSEEEAPASMIQALTSASRNRHLSELVQNAAAPQCLVYLKSMTSGFFVTPVNDMVLLTRSLGEGKRVVEVFVGEQAGGDESFWQRVWIHMSSGDFSELPDQEDLLANYSPGDSLSRSSSRRKEKRPWTVQDCSFFP
eukprot:Protomagalhaensia_wolfi_Nauph_80__1904@NODE_2197_length_1173_cov_39_397707_g1717_i0_p1_GENE_NODE_2197_length_1173_cov_39_397707_g1717_i0NODE_2197_length_1173_cov_39_397707_g1717_i0_p1_ORF_typecomplete_len244_score38_46STAS/PF01740_21/0_19_NODE_2197_length_1173_cov_39_397707_g1717_i04421119